MHYVFPSRVVLHEPEQWDALTDTGPMRYILQRESGAMVTTGIGDRLRAGIPSRAVINQLGQLSLASLRGRLIEYQLRLG